MRLWTLHPKYLDRQGLVGVWREALLAQAVLHGDTKGYRNHPQLERFKAHPDPLNAIACYLDGIYQESLNRGYRFDRSKFDLRTEVEKIPVKKGQIAFEWEHLLEKLKARCPQVHARVVKIRKPEPHPLFVIVPGGIADWERGIGSLKGKM